MEIGEAQREMRSAFLVASGNALHSLGAQVAFTPPLSLPVTGFQA